VQFYLPVVSMADARSLRGVQPAEIGREEPSGDAVGPMVDDGLEPAIVLVHPTEAELSFLTRLPPTAFVASPCAAAGSGGVRTQPPPRPGRRPLPQAFTCGTASK